MGRKKKRPAPGVTVLGDGRYMVRVKVTVRGQQREVQETLPHGSTLAGAVARKEAIQAELRAGGIAKGRGRAPTLADYTERWIELRAQRIRESSARTYADILGNYVLPHLGHLRVDDLRRADLEAWLAWLEGEGWSLRTRRLAWSLGLMVIRDACVDWDRPDPSQRLPGPRGKVKKAGRALTEGELGQLVRYAQTLDDPGAEAALLTLAYTGLRRLELSRQRWEDLDLEAGWLTASHSKTAAGEGRQIPLPRLVCEALVRLKESSVGDSPWVWPGEDGKARSPGWVSYLVPTAAKAAGLGHVTPHDLRRTYATLLDAYNVNRMVTRSLMGHSDDKETDRYVRVHPEDLRSALQVIEGGAKVGHDGGTYVPREATDIDDDGLEARRSS